MTEPHADVVEDPIDALIVQCLQQPPHRRTATLDGVCERHPDHAAALRRRYAFLEESGLVDGPQPTLPERIRGFRLVRRIGHGGMGVVYLAEQESLGRRVALKMIHPGLAAPTQARERFLREVRAVSLLDHPNICPVHDAGEIDGVPYLAMRYVEGETLAERIARQRAAGTRPDIGEVLRIGECIARALHAAHEKGLVHRDVKPDNVMLESGSGLPLLLDFGLAQLEDGAASRLTRPGDQLGTPAYMAPEQVAGQPADRRTDVYSLGATLYEALTFRVPHEAATREALYRRILGADVSHVGRHNRNVPRDLEVVLATALERDSGRRYATAEALAEDLRRLREHRPILARPAGPWTRVRKWLRRHPTRASLSVAAIVVGALGVGLWSALDELGYRRVPPGFLDGPRIEPLWSTFFGGEGREECVAIRRGPGGLVTVVGHTTSRGLGTAGVWQSSIAGPADDTDAFVARLDPSRPPSEQLLWCTYLGGKDKEYVFDAEVDPVTDITTLVGMTWSPDFPGVGPRSGSTDGFVAQIGPNGRTLPFAMRLGGSADDWICEVELAPGGGVFVAGLTESDDLPRRTNAHHGGGTDTFVARLDPRRGAAEALLWGTYLGGGGTENQSLREWRSSGERWEGNLDWMAMTRARDGGLAVAIQSRVGDGQEPAGTPGGFQHAPAGAADVYFAILEPDAGGLRYATYFGGSMHENPRAIATHPLGGFVVGGTTWSNDIPVTPGSYQGRSHRGPVGRTNDAFLCWIDPAREQDALRYATYLGGEGGEDSVCSICVGSDGMVTVAGFSAGGGFPVDHFLRPLPVRQGYGAMMARLMLAGRGADDLRFATCAAGDTTTTSLLFSVVLDDDGTAWVTGITDAPSFPTSNALQPELRGGREGIVLHLQVPPGH